jgi:hypothetical protein
MKKTHRGLAGSSQIVPEGFERVVCPFVIGVTSKNDNERN